MAHLAAALCRGVLPRAALTPSKPACQRHLGFLNLSAIRSYSHKYEPRVALCPDRFPSLLWLEATHDCQLYVVTRSVFISTFALHSLDE